MLDVEARIRCQLADHRRYQRGRRGEEDKGDANLSSHQRLTDTPPPQSKPGGRMATHSRRLLIRGKRRAEPACDRDEHGENRALRP